MKTLGIFVAGLLLGGFAAWLLTGGGAAATDALRLSFAGAEANTLANYQRIFEASDQDVKCLVARLSEATAMTLRETSLESSTHVSVGIQKMTAGLVGDALSSYQKSDIASHARSCQMTASSLAAREFP